MATLASGTLLALATTLMYSNGSNVRLTVAHDGNRPARVEIVGLTHDNQEVEVKAFPSSFVATKGNPRRVLVQIDPSIKALCSSTSQLVSRGPSGQQQVLRWQSCVQVPQQPTESSRQRGGLTEGDSLSRRRLEAIVRHLHLTVPPYPQQQE